MRWNVSLIAALAVLAGCGSEGRKDADGPRYRTIVDVEPSGVQVSGVVPAVETHRVRRVVDGNSIEVENGMRIHYEGVHTPGRGRRLYREALDLNRSLVAGAEVRVEFDARPTDRFGRRFGYVFVAGEDGVEVLVNERLLAAGLGTLVLREEDARYRDRLLGAQKAARARRIGLWRDAAEDHPCVCIRGETSFHRGGCAALAGVRPANLQTFPTRNDAFDAGKVPCTKCKP
jgi:endonuclease YncB( thermonuclease family)